MPEPYIIELPGAPTADRTRQLRDELLAAFVSNTSFPLARAFEILPLTAENKPLGEKMAARGDLAIDQGSFVNEGTPIDQKIVDQSLHEFNAYVPRRVRLTKAGDGTLVFRSEGSAIIATIESLPPELGYGERFVLQTVDFGADTVLIDFVEEDNEEHALCLKINLSAATSRHRVLRQRLANGGKRATLALTASEAATGIFCCCSGGGNEPLPGVQNINVHFKVLRTQAEDTANNPSTTAINQIIANQLTSMQQVYGTRFNIIQWPTEYLVVADIDIDAGTCTMGNTSAEQNAVFANRNNVGANDLIVYLVRGLATTAGVGLDGCASHPANQPGAIIRRAPGSAWVLGHELGHVLGLDHTDDSDRLMWRQFLGNVTNPPPDLIDSEIRTMQDSRWTTT